jgi:hypothetical protein
MHLQGVWFRFARMLRELADIVLGRGGSAFPAACRGNTVQIKYSYNVDRAVQVMAYIVERLGATDKVKLMKLVYLADRDHFIQTGVSITRDRQCAMQHGPVPSNTLNVINGDILVPAERVFDFLHLNDNRVELRRSPGVGLLSPSERQVLDQIIRMHGSKPTWGLVRETHELPEYNACFVEGTSRPIPYEHIAKVSGSAERFRLNRPVITQEMAAEMAPPLSSGADL